MFNGKMKAVTFSYDDGVRQDIPLIDIFNKYGLKATFNLNSCLLGYPNKIVRENVEIDHTKVHIYEVPEIYKGHEVALHTLYHHNLTAIDDESVIIKEVDYDRRNLELITGLPVVGMAYPCGGVNNDDRVADIIAKNTSIKYARTITSTHNFDLQENLLRFNPSVYHMDMDKMFELGEQFIELKPDKPQIFYIWGHSYEFDIFNSWRKFEEFCKLISDHSDIFYGTNKEVLLSK
ncbi:MAG: polysaccharide deacetylase family protein [Bacillota bacterium]|nr:polysaccharide deacetylase family protein [Bacillota bacterium]